MWSKLMHANLGIRAGLYVHVHLSINTRSREIESRILFRSCARHENFKAFLFFIKPNNLANRKLETQSCPILARQNTEKGRIIILSPHSCVR